MRARARAVAAAVGAAIVVVPLTGAAAAALVATEPDTATIQVSATSTLSFADAVAPVQADMPAPVETDDVPAVESAEVAEVPAVVAASDDVELAIDAPDLKVKKNPKPVVVAPKVTTRATTTSRSTSSARPVANSASVSAAISGSAVIAEAAKYVGTPYTRGGSSPAGFDCSGFISYVYGKLGVSLPHQSGAYYSVGTRVSSPQVGDIIVTPGHVGIYAGPNLQIDASTYGTPVRFHSIWQNNPVYIRVN